MALITDPDSLNQGTEVTYDAGAKTIALAVAGNLSADGVTLKALYSFTKEEWKSTSGLIPHPFPFLPITDEQYELKDGWDFANDTSRYLIKTGGWAVRNTSDVITQMWAGIITLGSIETGTQVYFKQTSATPVNFQTTGAINQSIKIFTNGGTNDKAALTLFARKQGDKYATSNLAAIGVTGDMTYQVYRFPLATSPDLKILLDSDGVNALSPYSDITVTYHSSPITRSIGGINRTFNSEVDGNGQAITSIYENLQYKLRLTSDIDAGAGTVRGDTADILAEFVGDTLKMKEGVVITDFLASDTNNILLDPIGDSSDIAFPFTSSLKLEFGSNLILDSDSVYRVFFTNDDAGDNSGRDYGTNTALTVKESVNDSDMSGSVDSASSITFSYDYDGNVQRGAASAGDDAPITVVATGTANAAFVVATGTIARSTSNIVSLVAAIERNYSNG